MNKALKTTGFILCGVIFISTILYLTRIMENADNIYMPCITALMFIQALENRKTNKAIAIISLSAGIFMLVIVVSHFVNVFPV